MRKDIDIDARLDTLSEARARGFDATDVKLTDNGHDFVVGLDAMKRLLAGDGDNPAEALLKEAIESVHVALHRGVRDEQLTNKIVDIAKRAGLWPLDPPNDEEARCTCPKPYGPADDCPVHGPEAAGR